MRTKLRLGTRGSPLALAQTKLTTQALAKVYGWSAEETDAKVETVVIKTTGDNVTDRSLADIGGKGLFAKEIEEALFDGRIDVAVHSAKDLPSFLPEGLTIAGTLERADPRDAFLSLKADRLADLPKGAIVGTSSVRRQALILSRRPDLKIVLFRGNVDTRLAKLAGGEVDATILAAAGLARLSRLGEARAILDPAEMLPAAAQGIVAFEVRANDNAAQEACATIDHADTHVALAMERAFLAALDGSCKTPLAALAQIRSGRKAVFHGAALSPNGAVRFDVERHATIQTREEAARLGADAGADILGRAGRAFLQA